MEIDRNGQVINQNGGLPFNGNITEHLIQLQSDIDRSIPNKTFDGVAVLDFEAWRPTFRQNFGEHRIYQKASDMDERSDRGTSKGHF